MNQLSSYTDTLAIGLSTLCVVHCLASPLLIVLLPGLTALQLENEAFHGWLLMAVVPTSLLSVLMGCKQHKFYRVFVIVFFGLLVLLSALLVEDLRHGELLEKIVTVVGASIVAFGHYLNFRLCRELGKCECSTTA